MMILLLAFIEAKYKANFFFAYIGALTIDLIILSILENWFIKRGKKK